MSLPIASGMIAGTFSPIGDAAGRVQRRLWKTMRDGNVSALTLLIETDDK
ncbi:hypothetical protein [Granulicella sibirica]|nr:hypothetical protein [Granulicella sibirica]